MCRFLLFGVECDLAMNKLEGEPERVLSFDEGDFERMAGRRGLELTMSNMLRKSKIY